MYISFFTKYNNFVIQIKKEGDTLPANKNEYMYKYAKEKLKRIPLDVHKKKYDEIKAAADPVGEPVNGYIKTAIDMRMENDKLLSNPSSVYNPPLLENPATTTKQKKQYQPFTNEDATKIDLQKLLKNIPYQLEIANNFGMDVLASLMEKARQQQESYVQK